MSHNFPSLMYHAVNTQGLDYDVSINDFNMQIQYILGAGGVLGSCDDLYARLSASSPSLPERYVVVTFDDGHRSNLAAAETIREMGGRATFFITHTFSQNRQQFMTDIEIRELSEIGEIGSHSMTHRFMSRLSNQEVYVELRDSKAWLEDITSKPVISFSLPNGAAAPRIYQMAAEVGYKIIGNSTQWHNTLDRVGSTGRLNRIAMRAGTTIDDFARIIQLDSTYYLKRWIWSTGKSAAKTFLPEKTIETIKHTLRQRAKQT